MVCSSGIGFDARPLRDGTRESERRFFGFHGIWQGTAVLYDRKTQSRWLHLTGECIDGDYDGATLTPIAGRHVEWREWVRDHPDTKVMQPIEADKKLYFGGGGARRGSRFWPEGFLPTIESRDPRLLPTALCYGVVVDEHAKAYPFSRLKRDPDGLVLDQVGDVPIVVVYDRDPGSAVAYDRRLGKLTLEFERTESGDLREVESGSVFNRAGVCVEGLHETRRLKPLFALQAEWYGWFAAYPHTAVWR